MWMENTVQSQLADEAHRPITDTHPILPVAPLFIDSLGKSQTIKRLATASYFFEIV